MLWKQTGNIKNILTQNLLLNTIDNESMHERIVIFSPLFTTWNDTMTRPCKQIALNLHVLIRKNNHCVNFSLNIKSNSHQLRHLTVFSPIGLCPLIRPHNQHIFEFSIQEYHFQNCHKMNRTVSVSLPGKALSLSYWKLKPIWFLFIFSCANAKI